MNHTVKIMSLPAKEYLVIKGCGKLYDPGVTGNNKDIIRNRIADGSVERLKKAACSETVYILFCNTCVRNDEDKCYDCGYDIACENHSGVKAGEEFAIIRLNPCEYAVFTCDFESGTTLRDAQEQPDDLFWNGWLKENPYTCAIDDPANWNGKGFAAIEQYTPLDPDASKFTAVMWYPIINKTCASIRTGDRNE